MTMEDETLETRLKRLEDRLGRLEEKLDKPGTAFPKGQPVFVVNKKPLPPSKPIDWEDLAGRWFNRIGVVAIVFAVSFFLKYAFEHHWIGELGRVTMGILSGMALLAAGDGFCRKKMAGYGQTLIGGGIAILYLSIYAAFGYYHLLDQGPAFGCMCLVTAAACALAVRQDALPIATLGLLGGFLTPRLMSTGVVQEHALFGYIALLNSGLALVSLYKDWRELNLLALALTQVYVQGYVATAYQPEKLWVLTPYLCVYWVLFLAASTAYYVRGGGNFKPSDVGLAGLNAASFFGTLYRLLKPLYHPYLGFLCLVLAAVYAALSAQLGRREKIDRNLVLTHLGLAIVFVTLAVPIQFDLKWVTIGWAAEAAALFAAGFKLDHKQARFMGAGVLLVAIARALVVDSFLLGPHLYLLNQRALSYGCVLGAILVCISGYSQLAQPHEQEKAFRSVFGVLGIFLGLWLLSIESREFWSQMSLQRQAEYFGTGYEAYRNIEIAKSFSLSAVWALYGFAWFLYGIWQERRPVRLLALAILSLTVLKVFLIDLSFLRTIWRILSLLGLGLVTLAVSYFYQREKKPAALVG